MNTANATESADRDAARPTQGEFPSDQEQNGEVKAMRGPRESARITAEALRDAGQKASVAVRGFGENAYQIGSRTGTRVARQVEAQPMASAMIAASLGLIIGMLLTRR